MGPACMIDEQDKKDQQWAHHDASDMLKRDQQWAHGSAWPSRTLMEIKDAVWLAGPSISIR